MFLYKFKILIINKINKTLINVLGTCLTIFAAYKSLFMYVTTDPQYLLILLLPFSIVR